MAETKKKEDAKEKPEKAREYSAATIESIDFRVVKVKKLGSGKVGDTRVGPAEVTLEANPAEGARLVIDIVAPHGEQFEVGEVWSLTQKATAAEAAAADAKAEKKAAKEDAK